MRHSELRINTVLMLAGMLAVLTLLAGVYFNKKPPAFGHYVLTDLGPAAQSKPVSHNRRSKLEIGLRVCNRWGMRIEWIDLPNGRGAQGILLDHGKRRDLGTLGGKVSYPIAIDDIGEVAGYSARADHSLHAFLWQGGFMKDLGTLGGSSSWAWDLDSRGCVVGEADTPGGATQAFLYDHDAMMDLGTLGGEESAAHSINDRGQIVGEAETITGDVHAFFYSNGVMTDLNKQTKRPRDWVLTSATRIDNTGRIWGEGLYHNASHTFVLTPVS